VSKVCSRSPRRYFSSERRWHREQLLLGDFFRLSRHTEASSTPSVRSVYPLGQSACLVGRAAGTEHTVRLLILTMGSIEILDRQRGADPFNRVSNYGVHEAVERVVWFTFRMRVVVIWCGQSRSIRGSRTSCVLRKSYSYRLPS